MGGRMRKGRRRNGAAGRPKVRRSVPWQRLHQLPPAQLQAFKRSTTTELERLRAHVKQTQATIADLQQVQSLVDRLEAARSAPTPPDGATRLPHAEVAADVLRRVGIPMPLKDLLVAMDACGAVVAGRTERQRRSNLIITLGRSGLVRRVRRGVYALAERRQSA